MAYLRARMPRMTKYRVRTVLTRSFGRNLKSKKSEKSTALPIKGNRSAASFDIVSCSTRRDT